MNTIRTYLITFLSLAIYSGSNCSESRWNPYQWYQQGKNYISSRLNNPRPAYFKGYTDWVRQKNPNLNEYSSYEPDTIRSTNALTKREYEYAATDPWAMRNLREARGSLQKDVNKPAPVDVPLPWEKRYEWQKYLLKGEEEFKQKQERAKKQLEELDKFIAYQEKYPQMRQQYKQRKSLLNPPSFSIYGKGDYGYYGYKLPYPEMPYSPYGD